MHSYSNLLGDALISAIRDNAVSNLVFHISNPENFWRIEPLSKSMQYLGVNSVAFCLGQNKLEDSKYKLPNVSIVSEQDLKASDGDFTFVSDDERGLNLLALRVKHIIKNKTRVIPPNKDLPNQYFETDIFEPCPNEIFVDGGSLDMSNSISFTKWCNNNYKLIYAFEPDANSYQKCIDLAGKDERLAGRCQVYNAGLWDKKETISFSSNLGTGSYINDLGDSKIDAVPLDEILDGKPVTFVKLDVEGAEVRALAGMAQTIRKYRPKLAVSIYHKPDDCLAIPLYILNLIPSYNFYIRHYRTDLLETVLYCI
ncbi:hypothetical protein RsTz2092_00250 [Deferribacterales bacterium RsTz2092]|nr:hypothetical protein AGMMS49941_11640 [Deferribacterales bacterium]